MRETIVMLLAGGVGSRLNTLVQSRAKPAVPFGGIYRIIDFTLSNVMHSGFSNVGILTQYRPLSLMRHIGTGSYWGFWGRSRSARILPPRTGTRNSDWYRGTADAIRQNLDYILEYNPGRVLILSGDHIYSMNYVSMIEFHKARNADVSIAIKRIPWDETKHFGIAVIDSDSRILSWQEKPDRAASNLASMGIYIFNTELLLDILNNSRLIDFGRDIIPNILAEVMVCAYPFNDYWADVGTLRSYWNANMDILREGSGIDLENWDVRTNIEEDIAGDRPPTYVGPHARIRDSIIAPGCIVEGEVCRSILSPGVRIGTTAKILDSVIMHDTVVGAHSQFRRVIADKCCTFGEKCQVGISIVQSQNGTARPATTVSGLTVIGKNAELPPATVVAQNTIIPSRDQLFQLADKQNSADEITDDECTR